MADIQLKKIERDAGTAQIVEYLDYLCERLGYAFENIGEENLTDELNKRIGGK